MTLLPVPAGQTYQPARQSDGKRTRDRVLVDGVDMTYFRDTECEISYELTEPHGYGPGSLTFPQITFLEEHLLGEPGDLAPFRDGAYVRVDRVDVDTNAVVDKGRYRGRIFTKRPTNGGLYVELAGHASGPLSQRWRPQPLVRKVRDCGFLAWQAYHEAGLTLLPKFGPTTGKEINNGTGGIKQLGWVDSVLALSYQGTPNTIMPRAENTATYEWRAKDTTTVHMTVWADAFGVEIDVVDDVTEKPNAYYGTGRDPQGGEWVNGRWPDLGPETVPTFPGFMTLGSEGSGVYALKTELAASGLLNLAARSGGYNAATVEAVKTVQDDAGLPVTGDVDEATWKAVWGDGLSNQRVDSAYIAPLVIRPAVKRNLRTLNGSVRGHNPKFDRSVLRVDRPVDFGPASKDVARAWSREDMNRGLEEINYYGTITLDTDVWEGEHVHGTPGTVREKERIPAGENILVRKPGRDILFHIASARRLGKQVVLTVDTKARDALHIGEMIARDEDARRDPSRNWRAVQKASRQTHDEATGWYAEDGAGWLPQRVECPANQWTGFWVPAGSGGQIQRTNIVTTSQPAAFVFLAAGRKFPIEAIGNRVPDAWALNEDDEPVWNDAELQDWLEEVGVCYVIGDATQPGGFWPKRHTNRRGETTVHPVTGVHKDRMPWPYTTFGKPVLWCAIFPDRDTVLERQELFRGTRNLGA